MHEQKKNLLNLEAGGMKWKKWMSAGDFASWNQHGAISWVKGPKKCGK